MMLRLCSLVAFLTLTLTLSLLVAAPLLTAPSLAAADDEEGMEVEDAWIRLPPPGSNAAAYLEIENESGSARTLVSAKSERAEAVEIHRTVVEDDVARMEPVESLEIPAGGEVVFEPRGLHLMLIRPSSLSEGERVEIELGFAEGEPLVFEAKVRRGKPGQAGHDGHGGHHHEGHH
jgi:copper(I)-binding protein